ncbi:MAG: hypothetical protein ACI8P0_001553 [Planctomycetaceae bacterium]|jgi:hypothetical protein
MHHLSNLTQMSNPQRLAESNLTTHSPTTKTNTLEPIQDNSNDTRAKRKTEVRKLSLTDLG